MQSIDDTKSHRRPDEEARSEPLSRDRRRFRRLAPCGRATLTTEPKSLDVISTAELVSQT